MTPCSPLPPPNQVKNLDGWTCWNQIQCFEGWRFSPWCFIHTMQCCSLWLKLHCYLPNLSVVLIKKVGTEFFRWPPAPHFMSLFFTCVLNTRFSRAFLTCVFTCVLKVDFHICFSHLFFTCVFHMRFSHAFFTCVFRMHFSRPFYTCVFHMRF
jgi:hypothetical protein